MGKRQIDLAKEFDGKRRVIENEELHEVAEEGDVLEVTAGGGGQLEVLLEVTGKGENFEDNDECRYVYGKIVGSPTVDDQMPEDLTKEMKEAAQSNLGDMGLTNDEIDRILA